MHEVGCCPLQLGRRQIAGVQLMREQQRIDVFLLCSSRSRERVGLVERHGQAFDPELGRAQKQLVEFHPPSRNPLLAVEKLELRVDAMATDEPSEQQRDEGLQRRCCRLARIPDRAPFDRRRETPDSPRPQPAGSERRLSAMSRGFPGTTGPVADVRFRMPHRYRQWRKCDGGLFRSTTVASRRTPGSAVPAVQAYRARAICQTSADATLRFCSGSA